MREILSLRTDAHGSSVQTQIDLSLYAAGVYFVKAVADGNVVAVRKMVKR
ncbi:MAG: T9SS type A sorting domain-containing protein [Bacteroidales bacterium]|nr:T9SS type A sorting domain-containing protein [Bacteroidales bacterium]